MSIPSVSYDSMDPDPVEWANNFVKPALDNAATRGLLKVPGVGQRSFQPRASQDGSVTYTTQDVLGLFQFILAAPINFGDVVFDVGQAGSSGQYRWGIYRTDLSTGLPSTKVFETSLSGTVGTGIGATGATFSALPGVHWAGWAVQAPGGGLRRMVATGMAPEGVLGMPSWLQGMSLNPIVEILTTPAAGTLPADLTGATFGLSDWHAGWTLRAN